MRPESSTTGLERKTGITDVRKKIIIVPEGYVTEENYFRTLIEKKSNLGITSPIDIVLLNRYAAHIGYSDPIRLIGLTCDYIHMLKTNEYSIELFTTKIAEACLKSETLVEITKEFINNLKDILTASGYCSDGMIINENKAQIICQKFLEQNITYP